MYGRELYDDECSAADRLAQLLAVNAAQSAAPGKAEMRVSNEAVFRIGDRLIVGKNNYQTLCFDGETGDIVDINPRMLTLRMDDAQGERLVEDPRDDWSQLQLAYAITSHRAQGSEWDNAVIVLSQSHYMMLQRNLLYTALTRARRRAVIIVSGGLQDRNTGRIYKTALEVAVGIQRPPAMIHVLPPVASCVLRVREPAKLSAFFECPRDHLYSASGRSRVRILALYR